MKICLSLPEIGSIVLGFINLFIDELQISVNL